jgi:hypothetical protein
VLFKPFRLDQLIDVVKTILDINKKDPPKPKKNGPKKNGPKKNGPKKDGPKKDGLKKDGPEKGPINDDSGDTLSPG